MKKLLFIVFTLLTFAACKKEQAPPSAADLMGSWKAIDVASGGLVSGWMAIDPQKDVRFRLYADNTFEHSDLGAGKGTWTMTPAPTRSVPVFDVVLKKDGHAYYFKLSIENNRSIILLPHYPYETTDFNNPVVWMRYTR
ncbi:hypothetical protein ACWKWU_10230 [Chitinophaga lutea]